MAYFSMALVGLVAGVLGGMFGIGGGLIIVPALMYLMKMKQIDATATSLAAMIPPVTILSVLEYYENGNVNIKYAVMVAAGLVVGFYFGAKLMIPMNPLIAKKLYAGFLVIAGLRMLIWK